MTTPLLLLSTVPYYLLAILLIYLFAIVFKAVPAGQRVQPHDHPGPGTGTTAVDIANHAILPALSIVLGAIGFWALGMRSLMVGVLGEDYITYADSKGLAPRRIFLRYGVRNALLPQITALALALATVVSGAILVEAIFNYPGLGGLLFSSVLGQGHLRDQRRGHRAHPVARLHGLPHRPDLPAHRPPHPAPPDDGRDRARRHPAGDQRPASAGGGCWATRA